jgi:polysaccharide export outer membrane protein
MIVGFTKRHREYAGQVVDPTGPVGTVIHRRGITAAAKAIDSVPLVQGSAWSRSRIFKTKTLQPQADEAKWEKPVTGLMKGSYPMKWSLVVLMAMLPALPVAAVAQQSPAAATAPSATQATANAAPKPSTTDSSDIAHYIIGAEDSLQITVWKEPTLSGTVPVRPDGRISLVLLGDLQAAGMTPMQLAADITQRLKKYVQDPIVSVLVLGVNSQRIFMIGNIGHVGALAMTPGMTPLQAIAAAGGLSPFAHSKRIYILRGTGAAQKKIPFDYKKALKGDDKQDVSLEPGDTIVVP